MLADIRQQNNSQFKVMRTDHNAFLALIEAWFFERANYIDVCGMPCLFRQKELNVNELTINPERLGDLKITGGLFSP